MLLNDMQSKRVHPKHMQPEHLLFEHVKSEHMQSEYMLRAWAMVENQPGNGRRIWTKYFDAEQHLHLTEKVAQALECQRLHSSLPVVVTANGGTASSGSFA